MTVEKHRTLYKGLLELAEQVGIGKKNFNAATKALVQEDKQEDSKLPEHYLYIFEGCVLLIPYLEEHVEWKGDSEASVEEAWGLVFIIAQKVQQRKFLIAEKTDTRLLMREEINKGEADGSSNSVRSDGKGV